MVYWLIPFGSAFLLTIAMHRLFAMNIWVAWLSAENLATLITYWYDKRIAVSNKRRVPELALLVLALFGGTPGAILGMQWFRHKTAKTSFRRKFRLVVVCQLMLLIGYVGLTTPKAIP